MQPPIISCSCSPSPSTPLLWLPSSWLIPEPLTIPSLFLPRPPPPPDFIAAFLLAPALWGPAVLLSPCCPSSSSSSLPRAWGSLPAASSPQCLHPKPSLAMPSLACPCFCIPGTMNNEELGAHGRWPAPRRLWLPGPTESPARVGRCCTRSQRGGIPPTSDAISTAPAPNRLLTLQRGGAGPPCQNSCKILFYTDETHILLQPHSQKSLNHFSGNFPKKVTLRLTPCKGYFSQNSLNLAKL